MNQNYIEAPRHTLAAAICVLAQIMPSGMAMADSLRDAPMDGLRAEQLDSLLSPTYSTFVRGTADSAPSLDGLPLPVGTERTDLGKDLHLSGMALRIQVFDAPAPLAATLHTLASGIASSAQVLTLADAVLLYWQDQRRQWLVRLAADGPTRTRGTLSVLSQGGAPQAALASSYPTWAPPGLRLQFDVADSHGAAATRQRVYTHALPLRRLAARLRASLRSDGWHEEPAAWSAGYWHWSRQGRSLSLIVAPMDAGSGLFVLESAR